MADDGFKLVVKGSKRCARGNAKRARPVVRQDSVEDVQPSEANVAALVTAINTARTAVEEAGMVDTVLEACRISPNSSTSRYEDIICYGLGSFGIDRQACSQLGLLIALKERTGTTRVLGYDPLWNSLELAALRALGCELIKSNECGRRTVERATLFFMPHCCLQLYDNLLWANWSPESLGNLSIIGNSIDGYDLRLGRKFQEKAWFMSTIHKSCIERSIDNKFEPEGVFNDLSFHEFPEQKMAELPEEVWKPRPAPSIEDLDELVTTDSHTP